METPPSISVRSAPVSVGNTIRGITPTVRQTSRDVVNVIGRDFVTSAIGTGTASNWNLVAGFPVTPVAFASSALQTYTRIYSKFKFNKLRVIYVTSSATSSSGDILICYNENRTDPMINYNSATFLNVVLSDPSTMLGIQWENNIQPIALRRNTQPKLISTGLQNDLDDTAQGEVLMFSRTPGTDSPGYFLIDYDVTFYELGLNPRLTSLSLVKPLYTPAQFIIASGSVNGKQIASLSGTRFIGGNTSTCTALSSYATTGDIYKLVLAVSDAGYSAWTTATGTTPTTATLFQHIIDSNIVAFSIVDGFTCYIVCSTSNSCSFYPSYTAATAASNFLAAGQTYTSATYAETSGVPSAGVWLFGYVSYVGNARPSSLQSN